MKLTFLGTKAYIDEANDRHRRHSSLLLERNGQRLRIDCGEDWLGRVGEGDADAILLTHAHPDHAFGLKEGSARPVYATEATWTRIGEFPIEDRHTIAPKRRRKIAGVTIKAYPVEHSIRAPAVAVRIEADGAVVLYAPDVVYIPDNEEAFDGVDLYVGDGSSIREALVRKSDDSLIGHAPIRTQIGWCGKHGVSRALFTHCGTEIVAGDERSLGAEIRSMGEERGVEAGIAHDGMTLRLP